MDDEPVLPYYENANINSDLEEDTDIRPTTSPPKRLFTRPFRNVLVSALVMCLVYSAFFPGGSMLEVVVNDNGKLASNTGFVSQGLTYMTSIITALPTPMLTKLVGIRTMLGISAALYAGLWVGAILLTQWSIYLGSAVTGCGMGLLWVMGPKILVDNSTTDTIQRNGSIWWGIYIFSMVIGNAADYFYLGNLTRINTNTRVSIYIVCCIFTTLAAAVGVVFIKDIVPQTEGEEDDLLATKSIDMRREPEEEEEEEVSMTSRLVRGLGRYKVTLFRREVGFLMVMLFYNSFVLAFYTMTFQTCIGNVIEKRNVIPLMSLTFGVTAFISCPIFERVSARFGNRASVIVLFISCLSSIFLTFIMFTSSANDANFDNKTNPYMEPTTPKVLIVAILLAFSDTGYNIIGNTAIGLLFQSDSDVGFMLLNSVMSCGTAFMFFTSCYFSLYTILAVEVIFCTLSTLIITLFII